LAHAIQASTSIGLLSHTAIRTLLKVTADIYFTKAHEHRASSSTLPNMLRIRAGEIKGPPDTSANMSKHRKNILPQSGAELRPHGETSSFGIAESDVRKRGGVMLPLTPSTNE
jgi:hypothetical protein